MDGKPLIVTLCVIALAILPACSRNGPPNSLFDGAGYHVRGDKVYYLDAFPGKPSEIGGADPATFESFDTVYARDKSHAYFFGHPIAGADGTSFQVLRRGDWAKDRSHVYRLDKPISDDPAHFELLEADLAKDSHAVYWTDGSVLSDDPAHFAIISDADHYLYTKDGRTVHVNGTPIPDANPATFRVLEGTYARDDHHIFYFTDTIADADLESFNALEGPYASDATRVYWQGKRIPGADPSTFRVLNANFECAADDAHAYYRVAVIANTDPRSFPPGRAVTTCDETSITFAE